MQQRDLLDDLQEQLVDAMLSAARAVVREVPYVGRQRAHEWALSGRLGIWFSRQTIVRRFESQEIRVDLEYDQMADGDQKVVGTKHRRIDLLLHRRGIEGPNLLACEVKPNDVRPRADDSTDLEKLRYLTRADGNFRYSIGMWLSLPRSSNGLGYYAIVVGGRLLNESVENGICDLH